MRCRMITLVTVLMTLAAGCASPPPPVPSNLTAGMAKKVIMKGQTTQAEVIEVFGPPDLVTHRDDMQIWTWDRIHQDVKQSSDYLALFVYGRQGSTTSSSTRTMMLIVYFDADDVVKEYRMISSRF